MVLAATSCSFESSAPLGFAPLRFALSRSATPRLALGSFAPLRSAPPEVRPVEFRHAEARFAELFPAEARFAELFPAEVCPAEVRLTEGRNVRLLPSPYVPRASAFSQFLDVLLVCHLNSYRSKRVRRHRSCVQLDHRTKGATCHSSLSEGPSFFQGRHAFLLRARVGLACSWRRILASLGEHA